MPKIIAVTMSMETILNREVNFLNFEYSQFVHNLGYTPLFIPNDLDYLPMLESLPISALLITGGHDIDLNYHSKNQSLLGSVTTTRDTQESTLFAWALSQNMPIIGICRGMQLINVLLGGDLLSDLTSSHPAKKNIHQKTEHQIRLQENIDGQNLFTVNSYHHQGFKADQLAQDLTILARSEEDQLIEAYRHTQKAILAVQWHPERAGGQFKLMQKLIQNYLNL